MRSQLRQIASLITLAILLSACAALMPKTVPEALAFNYITIESLSSSATQSLQAGSITADKARDLAKVLEEAFRINKMGETAWAANQTADASGYLNMASALLSQVEKLL